MHQSQEERKAALVLAVPGSVRSVPPNSNRCVSVIQHNYMPMCMVAFPWLRCTSRHPGPCLQHFPWLRCTSRHPGPCIGTACLFPFTLFIKLSRARLSLQCQVLDTVETCDVPCVDQAGALTSSWFCAVCAVENCPASLATWSGNGTACVLCGTLRDVPEESGITVDGAENTALVHPAEPEEQKHQAREPFYSVACLETRPLLCRVFGDRQSCHLGVVDMLSDYLFGVCSWCKEVKTLTVSGECSHCDSLNMIDW